MAKRKPIKDEIAVLPIYDRFATYPSNGLTPQKLAGIFKEADSGSILRQSELFEEMEEKDPHLFSQLQTRKNAVTGCDYELIPFDTSNERDKDICEFVKRELQALENIEDIMFDMLDAIGKGISVSEILWQTDGVKTTIADIKWKHPKCFLWDDKNIFKVATKDNPMGIELPENKFVIHKYKARSGHLSRAGVLRVVAWMYLFKNYGVKDWVGFCEVYGMPLRLGKYSPSASEDDKNKLMEALVSLGSDAAGIIPDGTSISFVETAKISNVNVYSALVKYCDEQISKAILGQTLTSDSGGSYAQSKTHNDVRHDLIVSDCKALAATIRRDIIRPLVLFNFGDESRIPYIRFDCEVAEELKETADIYKTLICDIRLPVPLSHLYKKFSIPQPEDSEAVAMPMNNAPTLEPVQAFKLSDKKSKLQKGQAEVDYIAQSALKNSGDTFDSLAKPLIKFIGSADSLEDIKAKLDDEDFILDLLDKMSANSLEDTLHKGMLYSDLIGRGLEDV